MSTLDKTYLAIIILIGIALIILGLNEKLSPPEAALTEWTEWAAKYVALTVAAQKIWKASDKLIARM